MASSFKKKSNRGRPNYPAGTKISLHNNQLLISTGVPSLDTLLGGGLAVGSVVLLEEDTHGCYAKTLLKCFLAEGVMSGHSVFLATADVDPEEIWKNLPCPVGEPTEISAAKDEDESMASADDNSMKIAWRYENLPKVQNLPCPVGEPTEISAAKDEDESMASAGDNSMKIAWRYENLPKVQSSQPNAKFGHFFDFTKTIGDERISKASKYQFKARDSWMKENNTEERSFFNPIYQNLLNSIKTIIEENGHCTVNQEIKLRKDAYNGLVETNPNPNPKQLQDQTILRIVIQSLDSPLWGATADQSLTMFLYYLRALLRSSFAVCFITVPSYLREDSGLIGRVERLADTVIRLESFAGSEKETNPIYKDYHGLFHLVRLPRLNSLTCHMPESLDLAFKLRRKKFVIEKLHLPPDVSETVNRAQEDQFSMNSGVYSCGASLGGSKLDF